MAKTFEVEIGGKVRLLRFNHHDAIELKKRFGEMPHKLLYKRVLGLDFEAVRPGEPVTYNPGLMDPEVQFALLHKALFRGGSKVREEQVVDWVTESIVADTTKSVADFVLPAVRCAFYSGAITGSQLDVEDDDAAGKASASEETP